MRLLADRKTFAEHLGQDVCGMCLREALTPEISDDLLISLEEFVRGDLLPAKTLDEEGTAP